MTDLAPEVQILPNVKVVRQYESLNLSEPPFSCPSNWVRGAVSPSCLWSSEMMVESLDGLHETYQHGVTYYVTAKRWMTGESMPLPLWWLALPLPHPSPCSHRVCPPQPPPSTSTLSPNLKKQNLCFLAPQMLLQLTFMSSPTLILLSMPLNCDSHVITTSG